MKALFLALLGAAPLGAQTRADTLHLRATVAGWVKVRNYSSNSSAPSTPAPRLVWELDRSAFARITGASFSCKRPGDTRLRVRWLDANGATIASDSTTIRCHP